MPTIDLAIVGAYFLTTLAGGLFLWKKNKSAAHFTTAAHAIPCWVCGLSILATYVSSISFLALPGKTFAGNWSPYVFSLGIPIGVYVGTRWFIPYYRRAGVASAYDHFERRFGTWARVYAASCFLFHQTARISLIIYLTSLPLRILLGWDIHAIIVLIGFSVTIYAFAGGITAVIWNDMVQTIILLTGAILCLVILLSHMPMGAGHFFSAAKADGKLSLGSMAFDFHGPTVWVVLLFSVCNTLQLLSIDQNYVQRYFVVKTEAEAKKSIWIGMLGYIPLSAIFYLIGTCLFYYYHGGAQVLPPEYEHPGNADSVYPYFIKTGLPTGIRGLLIAAIFSASMSAIASGFNAAATILQNDFYKRFFRREPTETQSLRVLRICTLAYGLIVTGGAMAMIHIASALDLSWTLAGIFGGGILGLFLLGLFVRRAGTRAAMVGVAAGLLTIGWMLLSPHETGWLASWRYPFHRFTIIAFATTIVMAVGVITATFSRKVRVAN